MKNLFVFLLFIAFAACNQENIVAKEKRLDTILENYKILNSEIYDNATDSLHSGGIYINSDSLKIINSQWHKNVYVYPAKKK